MSTNAELDFQLSLSYEYLKEIRKEVNERPDRNGELLMPVDVRIELALHQIEAAVELLRRHKTVSPAFTPVRSIR